MNKSLCKWLCTLMVVAVVIPAFPRPQETGGGNGGGPTATTDKSKKSKAAASSPAGTVSSRNKGTSSKEITSAQSSGKVWVNTESGIYHKSGRWYGKTKQGKFMSESEAKAAGYKEGQKE